MPRMPRLHVNDAYYHVLARGNNKQDIFHGDADYRLYLGLLGKYGARHGVTTHAYALMPNHVHLLVQVGTKPLYRLMHVLQQTYTQAHNKEHQRVGHLFQGRYKAFLIDDEAYLLALVRYIHLNPVEAGLCADPLHYRWSSHRHYMTGHGEGRVETGFIKAVMAEYGDRAIGDYQLLAQRPPRDPAPGTAKPPAGATGKSDSMSLDGLLRAVATVTGIAPAAITGPGKGRRVVAARRLFAYYASHQGGFPMVGIASCLRKSPASVSMAVKYVNERLAGGDGAWSAWVQAVATGLGPDGTHFALP